MSTPIADDPRYLEMLKAAETLTGPGQPYEMTEETVLGERVAVLRQRPRSLRQVLVDGCAAYGQDDCYVFDDGERITFAQLEVLVASVATSLRQRYGIGPGDRVAICAANCPEWLLTFWAVASLNAVVVAMNGWWTGTEMRNAIALTEPSVLLMDEKRLARLEGEVGVPVILIERDFTELMKAADVPLPDPAIAEDDPFMLIFTSGTTGRPKAATLSNRTVIGYVQLQLFIQDRSMVVAGVTRGAGRPSGAAVPLSPLPCLGNGHGHLDGDDGWQDGLALGPLRAVAGGRPDAAGERGVLERGDHPHRAPVGQPGHRAGAALPTARDRGGWVGDDAGHHAQDRGPLPAPVDVHLDGVRVDRDRRHRQLGPQLDAPGRSRLRRTAAPDRRGPHHRRPGGRAARRGGGEH